MSSPESEKSGGPARRGGGARRPRTRRHARPADEASPRPSAREEQGGTSSSSAGDPGPPRPEHAFGWSFRDFLTPYILLSLSVQRAHGYFIEQYLRGLGIANVEMSTLYRTLRQLEKEGLVHSTWEPGPDGPARRIYNLTDAGRWWLDAGAATLASYRSLIDRFFGSYSGPADRSREED